MTKPIILLIAFSIVLCQSSFSQNGYKQFRWGMKANKVSSLVPDIEFQQNKSTTFFSIAFLCKYGTAIDGTIPDPLNEVYDRIDLYQSQESDMDFFFIDSSLFAVAINQIASGDNSFSLALDRKYGYSTAHGMIIGSAEFQVKAWYNSGDRIITFGRNVDYESVTYLNKAIFLKLAGPISKQLKKQNQKQKGRLD